MSAATSRAAGSAEPAPGQDFSLVLGGPLFQILRRARLSDDALGLLKRRIVCAVLITWAPLMALSALQGGLVGPGRTIPLLNDVGTQLRFLVVVPLLIAAELIVHWRMQPIIDEFHVRSLIPPRQDGRYQAALAEAARWRDSALVEVILIALVYAAGILVTLRRYHTLGGSAWYASPSGGISLAGLWVVFVSLPLLQFLLLRWYFRLFIWAKFLWRMSRLDLDLNATHPDKAGGLGFLADSLIAFVPIAVAHGVLFAGAIADQIFYAGARFPDFSVKVFAGAVILVIVFAGPLMVFAPLLAHVKRVGLLEYGAVGQTYAREFRAKWLAGDAPVEEPLLGSGDLQSLADLGNSYGAAEQMRLAPIRPMVLAYFLAAFLAPILPLLLTMMSAKDLIGQLVGLVF
jgi:hypothetical protein